MHAYVDLLLSVRFCLVGHQILLSASALDHPSGHLHTFFAVLLHARLLPTVCSLYRFRLLQACTNHTVKPNLFGLQKRLVTSNLPCLHLSRGIYIDDLFLLVLLLPASLDNSLQTPWKSIFSQKQWL